MGNPSKVAGTVSLLAVSLLALFHGGTTLKQSLIAERCLRIFFL